MFWFVLPKGGVNGEKSTSPHAVENTRGGMGLTGKSGQQWRTREEDGFEVYVGTEPPGLDDCSVSGAGG